LGRLAQQKAIRLSDKPDEAMQALVKSWSLTGLKSPRDIAIIANTNQQTEMLNAECQRLRLEAGYLPSGDFVRIRDRDLIHGDRLEQKAYRGDRVLFTRSEPNLGIQDGDLGTIVAIHPQVGNVSVQLDRGGTVIVSPTSFPHIRLGYAMTKYKGPRDRLPRFHVLLTEAEKPQSAIYVQDTRAQEVTTIFTTRKVWNGEENILQSRLADILSKVPNPGFSREFRVTQAVLTASDPDASTMSERATPQPPPSQDPPRHEATESVSPWGSEPLPTNGRLLSEISEPNIAVHHKVRLQYFAIQAVKRRGIPLKEFNAAVATLVEDLQIIVNQHAQSMAVPPENIEVIGIREWEERISEEYVRIHTEIRFEITKYHRVSW
jgi:hypothetical protein